MTAGKLDLTIEQGATFRRILTWKDENGDPIDLTGYTARMQARSALDSPSPFIDITTENGGIALGGVAGTIILLIAAADTAAISENAGIYDLELESSGNEVTRLLEGKIILNQNVTHA